MKILANILIIFLMCTAVVHAHNFHNNNAQKPFVVVLDAGHGGKDSGNTGNSFREADIALSIVMKVGGILEKNPNFKVIYTRKTDVFLELTERAAIANKADADLFVSVHCDSHSSQAYGAGTFVLGLHKSQANFE
ncbi:MAG: N-acetylmuramoyl-L-alanine amidase, partial [Bacteroidetes bacterium]|nr:N-acetylmuramoyl-L-alanine amidase [Bacteroidota bacterium]